MGWNYRIGIVLYIVILCYLSLAPVPQKLNPGLRGTDKVAHVAMYFVLTALISVGMRRAGRKTINWRWVLLPPAFASVIGMVLELNQAFLPYRSHDAWDMISNTIGALLAQLCIVTIVFLNKKNWLFERY